MRSLPGRVILVVGFSLSLSAFLKKKDILPFVTTGMDLEGIMLGEISQTEKDKYYMISCVCRI